MDSKKIFLIYFCLFLKNIVSRKSREELSLHNSTIHMNYCCKIMQQQIEGCCSNHKNIYDCPDCVIDHVTQFDEYWIIIHDGWTSKINILFCPWCWQKLPESKRDQWFEELEKLWFDNPWEQNIPEKYQSDQWFK